MLGHSNKLVFETLDQALKATPGGTPMLHSDRGFQYTSSAFVRDVYNTFEELKKDIDACIHVYNNERLQAKLNGLSPMEFRAKAA